jgi:hypothetical protein
MPKSYSRRNFFQLAGSAAATVVGGRIAAAQQKAPPSDAAMRQAMRGFMMTNPEPFPALQYQISTPQISPMGESVVLANYSKTFSRA